MVQTVSAAHGARETLALLAPDAKAARRHAGLLMQDPAAGSQLYGLWGKAFETRIQTFVSGRGDGANDGTSVIVVGEEEGAGVVGEEEGARPQSILKSSPRTVEQSEGLAEDGVHQLLIVQVFVQTNPCASQ